MLKVFISYATQGRGKELAEELHANLKEWGVDSFVCHLSVDGGKDVHAEINKELRGADYVVYLATAEARNSFPMGEEMGKAMLQEKTIIPVFEKEIKPEWLPLSISPKWAVSMENTEQIKALFVKYSKTKKTQTVLAVVAIIAFCLFLARSS